VLAHKDDYRQCYTVERTCAWLGAFRWLLIHWERLAGVHQGFFAFALMVLNVRVAARSSSANSEQGVTRYQAHPNSLSPHADRVNRQGGERHYGSLPYQPRAYSHCAGAST